VRIDYHAGTTWAPAGQTPVVTGPAVRYAVKMVSAAGQHGELSSDFLLGHENEEVDVRNVNGGTGSYES